MHARHRAVLGVTLSLAAAGVALAAPPPPPDALQRPLETPEDPSRKPDSRITLPAIEEEVKPLSTPITGTDGQELPRFTLLDVALTGNRSIATEDLRPAYSALIGTVISIADLFAIRDALQNIYLKRGYFLTRVILEPDTLAVAGAVPKIRVVEGLITDVVLNGDPGPVAAYSAYRRKAADRDGCHPVAASGADQHREPAD
ncbi:POTRA domain-containing protein [Niveispirillum lacus]|uniref:POTRA domain-containing protein n=1 Tax=Niveispirillum lacus TaxID=1981099 RepID=UPI0013FD8327|nr:POTRA domain-containing protein [Niveispirillum lacus]